MVKKDITLAKAKVIQAALEAEGLDNPVSVVAIINAVSAILVALEAVQSIRHIIKGERK